MGYDRYGGQKAAARALGVEVATIRRYCRGTYDDGKPIGYPVYLDFAMGAIAAGQKPWSEDPGPRERVGL